MVLRLLDRRHENWSNLVWVQNLKTKQSDQFTEIGSSDRRIKRSRQDRAGPGRRGDRSEAAAVVAGESYDAERADASARPRTREPLKQELPPFYLPQALGHLLPRLVPLREPKTFLFATYVERSGAGDDRYSTSASSRKSSSDGKQVRAVPITDRIGLEGSPTDPLHQPGRQIPRQREQGIEDHASCPAMPRRCRKSGQTAPI